MLTIKEFEKHKELFLIYLTEQKRKAYNTRRAYNADMMQLIEFWKSLEEAEHQVFLFDDILERFSAALSHFSIDKSSIARKISCFNSLKKFLKDQGITITVTLKRPFVKLKDPQALNIQEVFQLMDEIQDDELPTKHPLRDKAIIELLYATGIRCSELVNIELNNIDFTNQSIVIRGKNKRERLVYFGEAACHKLKTYIYNERSEVRNPYERLFLNYRNTPITVRSIQRICAMFRECLESKYMLTPHILRHTFAAHMLSNGADLETVQELLGHKTRASTERYAAQITNKQV